MASASSSSARNLFNESKKRLSDRVQVNVNHVGHLAKQVIKGSRSNEILGQAARSFAQTESVMDSSESALQRMQVTLLQLNNTEEMIRCSVNRVGEVQEQIRDMQR